MNRFHAQGFSLIELLITLAIVAVLASITAPTFSGFVTKSRRADAMVALLSVQLAQENYRAQYPAYAPDLAALGKQALSPDRHYRLSVSRAGSSDFLVVARPVGVQGNDRCGAFAVDAQGPIYSGPYADRQCWSR